MKKLYRSESNRMFAGVLGGLAEYFHMDATILRLLFAVLLITSVFTFGLVYLVAVFIIPNERDVY
ncbi:PspC domain-containing protein [Virgibacillus xinjiangensis]|uniref:PspC domain-containing protein n=1 Tax=Virgibacillus xinjiangensis TaxID=393090 RepID=A0ABV7CY25_9BACI